MQCNLLPRPSQQLVVCGCIHLILNGCLPIQNATEWMMIWRKQQLNPFFLLRKEILEGQNHQQGAGNKHRAKATAEPSIAPFSLLTFQILYTRVTISEPHMETVHILY